MRTEVRLTDLLPEADIEAPAPEYVGAQPFTVGLDTRLSLFQHPPSRVAFPPILIGSRPSLSLACALKEACWGLVRTEVYFRVHALDARGREHLLLDVSLDARHGGAGRAWASHVLDLARFQGQRVRLVFTTTAPEGADLSYCWAGWGDPVLSHGQVAASVPRIRRRKHRNLLVITADALRADHLGCYGSSEVRTPHLDALASDGTRFLHARAQSVSTPASTASLFTGLLPPRHGILAEWGAIRPRLRTLPGHLRWLGYHTVFAPSEADISRGAFGLGEDFDEVLPCLATPYQPGSVTVRRFARWLERRPDAPFFAWAHFFDAHPPCTPPEPFRSMYYKGSPREPARAWKPERVREVRAVESLLRLELALPHLERGIVDADLSARLTDTAAVLAGRISHGPDLADHLRALGPEPRLGLSVDGLAAWLEPRARALAEGLIDPGLTAWLHSLTPHLRRIEEEILSWLQGVSDFRYPLAQYKAAVSHLDANVGALLAEMKRHGVYEDTVTLFCSPHGEILDENGACFHHHALHEEVLRAPVILKPAGARRQGQVVDGVLDLIDLLPTLLDALDAPAVEGLDGVSRWESVQSGKPSPEHDSLAFNICGSAVSLTRPPYVFERGERFLAESHGHFWAPGVRRLRRLDGGLASDPRLAAQMEARLDALLSRACPAPLRRAA
jgi:hypothetical protein